MSELTYSYVALLDVLAYREYLERDRASGQFDFRDAMSSALSVFTTVNQVEFGYTAISDTIIVTCSSREKVVAFLKLLKRIQISFLKEGLFLRGAAVFAQHFQSGNLTYSPALARAHELEQKTAIYPRIMVDKNILEMFETNEKEIGLLASELVAEWNGVFFLNILDSRNWTSVYRAASEMFVRDAEKLVGQESAFAKHVWFENYLFAIQEKKNKFNRYIPRPVLKEVACLTADVPRSRRRTISDADKGKARARLTSVFNKRDDVVHEGAALSQAGVSSFIVSLWLKHGWITRQEDGYLRLTKKGFAVLPKE